MKESDTPALRVAVTDVGHVGWTGGVTYRHNLLEALLRHARQHVRVYVVSNDSSALGIHYPDVNVLECPPVRGRLARLARHVTERYRDQDYLLKQTLQQVPGGGVDVIFPARRKVGSGVALLGWIPDFQHLHLPEMYTQGQIKGLSRVFREWIAHSTLMVLSSQHAQADFRAFSPEFAHKSRVMNFVAWVPPEVYEIDPEIVVRSYHLPEKFFYLPNQFWKHKNHMLVLEALHVLKQQGLEPFVVFTGNPVDSRNPLHLAELMTKLSEWGLRERVAFLGLVPHQHVYLLMRQSICVLNPSLFEGWSTTVEEAKSLGKRLLLSDIAVHREQAPPKACFFDPHQAGDLAERMAAIWTAAAPGPDTALENRARHALPDRMQNFAARFVSIAQEATQAAQAE